MDFLDDFEYEREILDGDFEYWKEALDQNKEFEYSLDDAVREREYSLDAEDKGTEYNFEGLDKVQGHSLEVPFDSLDYRTQPFYPDGTSNDVDLAFFFRKYWNDLTNASICLSNNITETTGIAGAKIKDKSMRVFFF